MTSPPIAVQGIDHINMSVGDLEASIRFYTTVFGFEIREDHRDRAGKPYVIMGTGKVAYLAIYQDASARQPKHPHFNHFGFVVGPLDAARARLQALGIAWLYDDEDDGLFVWAHSRSTYIQDPDGHEIELVEVFGGGN